MILGGSAKVFGRAFLQGSVLVTDTAEVFGLAKILDFSQVLGNSKLCGNIVLRDFDVAMDVQNGCSK